MNNSFNANKGNVSYFQLNVGGGHFGNPLEINEGVRPHIAKSYFETYKIYDPMQKVRPISQKFAEILRFDNFEINEIFSYLGLQNFL